MACCRRRNAYCGLLVLYWISFVLAQEELPPRVTWRREDQDMIVIDQGKGKNYMINCTADGYPAPTFEWRKDGIKLSLNGEYIKAYINGTLYFKEFSSREEGLYQCVAINPLGKSLSVIVPIVIEKPPGEALGNAEPKTLVATEGEPFSLPCADTPKTIPESIKRWYTSKGADQVVLTKRIGTDLEGNLRFAVVEMADQNSYVCALAPENAQEQDTIRLYNTVEMQVKNGQKGPFEPRLEFSTGNGNAKVFLNKKAILECFFSGFPEPTIYWKNPSNHDITGENKRFTLTDFNRRLIIHEVRAEDEGKFSCTADNGHGVKAALINVNVTSPPFKVLDQGLIGLIKPEGEDVVLQCRAKAANTESLNTPVWYRNGDLLREDNLPDPHRYSFNSGYTQLNIRAIDKTVDTACFQCNVTNSEGYTFYDGFLKVIDTIKISRKPNEVNEVEENDAIDISVRASGDKCCDINYQWYLNDKLLTPQDLQTPPLLWDSKTNTLMFNTTNFSDDVIESKLGKYKCRVSNQYQQVFVEFSITKKGVKAPETAAAEFELWWIAIILGILFIIIAIIIIFCCIKRNYPRETYPLEKTELRHDLNPKEELLNKSFQEI